MRCEDQFRSGDPIGDIAGVPRRPQARAPYAEALARAVQAAPVRLSVPGHAGAPDSGIAELIGERAAALDIAPLIPGLDLPLDDAGTATLTALDEALALAAEAWGAQRTWFLTNGATQANHTACLALRGLGRHIVVQRSMHSSVMDGMALADLTPHIVMPSIDRHRGMAHGVTPASLDLTLAQTPDAVAAYVVSPSYFGAVSDIRALADIAHGHGVPLVVDEAWGAHLGFHADLPVNALRRGADLVISSTHKLGGSLGQSAMIHLGRGPWAEDLAVHVERALRVTSSTSTSSLLLASLDLARRDLVTGSERIARSIADVAEARRLIAPGGRYTIPSAEMLADPAVFALDPLHLVVDTESGGISGHLARDLLYREYGIHVEMSTNAVIVALVGAGGRLPAQYLARALASLPSPGTSDEGVLDLPEPGPRAVDLRTAMWAPTELVDAERAVGRISADSLAAYPPGVPNLLPGEVITAEVRDYLVATAAAPHGFVRGAADPSMGCLRVLTDPPRRPPDHAAAARLAH